MLIFKQYGFGLVYRNLSYNMGIDFGTHKGGVQEMKYIAKWSAKMSALYLIALA